MNELIPQNFGAVSSVFGAAQPESDNLAAGVQGGYALMKYKGKVWTPSYRGNETPLLRADGDGPANSITVVVLKASQHLSKIFYEAGYTEGSTAAPDCFSTNGVTPDMASAKRQANACAACPKNAWGSAISRVSGKAAKACQDSKRIAIVPLDDLKNELYGGPMLLRIPAASLQELAQFGQKMQALGYPYYSIGVRISFDPGESYPKFLFSAIRPLSDEEGRFVLKLREDPLVARILGESEYQVAPVAALPAPAPSPFEQPQPSPQPAPVQAPAPMAAPQPAPNVGNVGVVGTTAPVQSGFGGRAASPAQAPSVPTTAASPAPAPVTAAGNQSSFEDTLDAKLGELLPPAA